MLANERDIDRPSDIDRLSPTLVVACARCFIGVGCRLPLNVVAYAHQLIHFWVWVVRFNQANYVIVRAHYSGTSVVSWSYHSSDISYGLRTLTKRHRPMRGYYSEGLHILIFACVHRLDNCWHKILDFHHIN